jgi:hypothetical protein
MTLGELLQDRGKHIGADSRRRPEREAAGAAALERIDLPPPIGKGLQRAHGVRQEGVTSLGELHPARRPYEERRVELALETLEPRGQGRLREEELVGRPAHVFVARDGDEGLDLAKGSHKQYLSERSKETMGVIGPRGFTIDGYGKGAVMSATATLPLQVESPVRAEANEVVTSAELAECSCPDSCERDHDRD